MAVSGLHSGEENGSNKNGDRVCYKSGELSAPTTNAFIECETGTELWSSVHSGV